MIESAVDFLVAIFLGYFIVISSIYLVLFGISLVLIIRHDRRLDRWDALHRVPSSEIPVSVLVPAFNEEASIVSSVRSLLRLDYSAFEVIVVCDGCTDQTLERLLSHFNLYPLPPLDRPRLATKPVRAVYASRTEPRLRVVDKENGGKADALNVGINESRNPLFCAIDADSLLERSALRKAVRPFAEQRRTIACGGTIRVANGSRIRNGEVIEPRVPRRLLPRFQVVEYLRAFLYGRLGWSPFNALLIISGAFGVFRRDVVEDVGGYLHDTIGEDMELIARLHRHCRDTGRDYRITFVPDPVCWTVVPEDLRSLRSQRVRWQIGLAETLRKNRAMLRPGGGFLAWLAYPYFMVFELFGPVVELSGVIITAFLWSFGLVSDMAFYVFLALALGMGTLLSLNAVLLDELSFRVYGRISDTLRLLPVAVLDQIGYRQLTTVYRLEGLIKALRRKRHQWGAMTQQNIDGSDSEEIQVKT